jgi:hypothetical protein
MAWREQDRRLRQMLAGRLRVANGLTEEADKMVMRWFVFDLPVFVKYYPWIRMFAIRHHPHGNLRF